MGPPPRVGLRQPGIGAPPWGEADVSPSPRSVEDLGGLLARFADGGFVVGAHGRIVLWNPGAQRILGYAAHEVVGKRCRDFFPQAGIEDGGRCDRSCHLADCPAMRDRVSSFAMPACTKSGRPVWLDVSVVAAFGPDGESITTHLFRDATEIHQLAAGIRRGLAPLHSPREAPLALTRREVELLELLTSGASTKAITERLHVSRYTVRTHLQNIFKKLGVHSRLEAVALMHRLDARRAVGNGAEIR